MTPPEATEALRRLAADHPTRPGAVHLERNGDQAAIILDNSASRHAMTLGMMASFAAATESLLRDPPAVVLLKSSDDLAFCAGGQLDELVQALDRPGAALAMCLAMGAVLDAFADGPFVSLCAVGGPAVGGGAELVTACDHVWMGPGGSLFFAQAGLGIAAGWGGVRRLTRRLGRDRALRITLGNRPIAGEEAERSGLAVAHADPARAAQDHAQHLLTLPAGAVRAIKTQVVAAQGADPSADAGAFAAVWGAPAHRAALAARRPPR